MAWKGITIDQEDKEMGVTLAPFDTCGRKPLSIFAPRVIQPGYPSKACLCF